MQEVKQKVTKVVALVQYGGQSSRSIQSLESFLQEGIAPAMFCAILNTIPLTLIFANCNYS